MWKLLDLCTNDACSFVHAQNTNIHHQWWISLLRASALVKVEIQQYKICLIISKTVYVKLLLTVCK